MLKILFFGCVVLIATCLWSQEPANPADLGSGSVTRQEEARGNTLRYGLSTSAAFDDNAQGFAGQSNITNSIQPQIELSLSRPRTKAHIFYGPSYTFSTDVASQRATSQSAGFDSQYLFSRRLSLSLRTAFVDTSNPLQSVDATQRLPQLGVLERESNVFVGTNVRQTSEQIGSDLTYRTSEYTSIGIGGSFTNAIYRTTADQTNMLNESLRSQAWSAHMFVGHRFSPVYSVGLTYSAQNFSSQQALATTLTHSALGYVTISFNPHVQLSTFMGPELSKIAGLGANQSGLLNSATPLTLSYGSTLHWQGERNGLIASYVQRVGNSVQSTSGAVRARTVSLQADRQLTKRIGLSLFGNYFSNAALEAAIANVTPDSVIGGVGITRPLTPAISFGISAFHQEFLSPISNVFGPSRHNVVSASISYNFVRPIGR